MVPAFNKPPRVEMDVHNAHFNTKLAKARIKTEHCIGLIKARFQFFKGIKIDSPKSMQKLIRYFTCACVMHNLLISDPIPPDWERQMQSNGLDEDDELNLPAPESERGNERRKQLLCYLLEIGR